MKIGIGDQYEISESAIDHIVLGNFSDRQDKDDNNKTILTKVISGGLHTMSAWENFLKFRPDVKHALLFNPEINEKWYYARRLQNEVILLRIPRECFQSKAANITMLPESNYVSGYLWKTLFPPAWSREIIISKINEALHNLDLEECVDSLLVGYADAENPLKTVKIRIQFRGNEILSAFPTWGQPMTGNNGKPFSHLDSINTIISSSCIFCNQEEFDKVKAIQSNWDDLNPEAFITTIPDFIKMRPKPYKDERRTKQQKDRKAHLIALGESASKEFAENIFRLAKSDLYTRYTFDAINYAFNKFGVGKSNNLTIFNSYSLYENFKEFLILLSGYDKASNTTLAFQIIKKCLVVRFIRTGGLDLWESKRLLTLFHELITAYSRSDIAEEFLSLLNDSPIRIGAYVEFNLNQFTCKDIAIIGVTPSEGNPVKETYFYVFVALALGLNYTINFEHKSNLELARHIQRRENPEGVRILKCCILHAIDTDFQLFSQHLPKIFTITSPNKELVKVLDEIIYDYFRCLASTTLSVSEQFKRKQV